MISFFANLFGYVLNYLYVLVQNYGLAIILFSVLVKVVMVPISIKQQKTMKKSQKLNEEMKQIQFKYKNDPEKLNQEVMSLYKREKMSPFSGCLSAIVQLILLISVFMLVRSPLTYMKKIDPQIIENLGNFVQSDDNKNNYKEIAIVNYINELKNEKAVSKDNDSEKIEENEKSEENNQENTFDAEKYIDEVYINMNFLGLDLSKVPVDDLSDWKVLIIPVLYIISSFISIKLSTNTNTTKNNNKKLISDGENKENNEEYDPMAQANKSMTFMMPIMSIMIACIAPLGLALYWFFNNILMIIERIVLNIFIKDEEEEANENA